MQGHNSFTWSKKNRKKGRKKQNTLNPEKSVEKFPAYFVLRAKDCFIWTNLERQQCCVCLCTWVGPESYGLIYKQMLWKPTCPIMFKDIPFITWSPKTLSYQEMTFSISIDWLFPLLILYIFVYPGKTNVCLDANDLIMSVLNVKVTHPLLLLLAPLFRKWVNEIKQSMPLTPRLMTNFWDHFFVALFLFPYEHVEGPWKH